MTGTPYWFLGLAFDVATLAQFRQQIFQAAETRQPLVFATPNVSFLAQASRDARFREDILRADFCTVDGMPVVWLGRLLGIPFTERLAGSDLLESLMTQPGPRPLRVYFFGGQEGAAEAAVAAVNRTAGGLIAVGSHYPGFAGIEEMSGEAVIADINRSRADLLVVALGAAKGHRWIEANRHRLEVPVISHLGAAINFIAGRLQRAPRLVGRLGLEWLWRIKEEPALFGRYARDGGFLARHILTFVIPEFLRRIGGSGRGDSSFRVLPDGSLEATFTGRFTAAECQALRAHLATHGDASGGRLTLRLRQVTALDPSSVGWLYATRYRRVPEGLVLLECDAHTRDALVRWRAGFLAEEPPANPPKL
jgi:N-acetylglucosaminyldiphosphoundecaprenol N-acetyl-beta-D-mannosaminyltransferase